MKKVFFHIFAAASVIAASCTELSPVIVEQPDSSEVTISINASLVDNTKTYITHDTEGYHANWNKSDVLGIAIDENYGSRKSFTNQSVDGADAVFTGSVSVSEGSHYLTGFYPKDYTVSRSEAAFEITIPTTQTLPSLSSFDKAADFLVAKKTTVNVEGTSLTSVDMPFRRAICILKVIPEDNTTGSILSALKVNSISIASANDYIAGRSLKCYVDESKEDELVSGKGSKTVTANYSGSDFVINGSNAAYIIVAPNKFSGGDNITIDITTNNARYTIHKVVAPENDINLIAGRVKPLRILIKDADVTVDPSPGIDADPESVSDVAAAGASGTISLTYVNASGWTPSVDTPTGCVSSAYLDSSNNTILHYTVGAYDPDKGTSGSITVRLSNGIDEDITKVISFTQQSLNHTRTIYATTSSIIQTYDGTSGGSYFTYKDQRANLSSNYSSSSYTINTIVYESGIKLDSKGYVTFTTDETLNSSVRFYFVSKSNEEGAKIQLLVGNNESTTTLVDPIFTPYSTVGDSGDIALAKNTMYTIKQKSKEQALLLVVVTETE